MDLVVNVEFNVGDIVKIKTSDSGYFNKNGNNEVFVKVSGYVIHHSKKSTRVYYTVEDLPNSSNLRVTMNSSFGHKKRYNAKDLEKV